MKTKQRKLTWRIIAAALLLLAVIPMLASCGSKKPTLVVNSVDTDSAVNTLGSDDFRNIGNMMASVYAANYDVRAYLIAATRGYDMLAENFDDSKVSVGKENTNADGSLYTEEQKLAIAKNVILKANEKADDSVKVGVPKIEGMNYKDITTLVGAFATSVDVNSGGNIFDKLLTAIGKGLGWMTNTLCGGSYLIGICLFAVVIELLMIYFAIKQQKNSIRQATLRPKEMAIRNKYKGRTDQVTLQKMQQEIQEFYQRENFSPYSGCLQLLIQMPIIMALYYIVIDPMHYVLGQASAVSTALNTYFSAPVAAGGLGKTLSSNGTIGVLSELNEGLLEGLKNFAYFSNSGDVFNSVNGIFEALPDFTLGSVNLGLNPGLANPILLIVPVVTFIAYFFTSKIQRKFMVQPASNSAVEDRQVACSNTMMDVTMPAMSTVFAFAVPALVGIYWIFRSFLGLLKSFIISRLMPLPVFTEEDYKAAAREMAGKQKNKPVQKSANAGKVRSLHHIDDEDYEDTREIALARKAAIEEREREEQAKKAGRTPFEAAPMKKDDRKQKNNGQEVPNEADETDTATEAVEEPSENENNQ